MLGFLSKHILLKDFLAVYKGSRILWRFLHPPISNRKIKYLGIISTLDVKSGGQNDASISSIYNI